jgi:hypothetical protein
MTRGAHQGTPPTALSGWSEHEIGSVGLTTTAGAREES